MPFIHFHRAPFAPLLERHYAVGSNDRPGRLATRSVRCCSSPRSKPARPVQLGRIAETQRVPPKYLELIMLDLKKAGWWKSARGPKGGYKLSRPSEQISFGEVVRTMEGPIALVSCASRQFLCALRRLPGRGDLRDPARVRDPSRPEHRGARFNFPRSRGVVGGAAGRRDRLAEQADPARRSNPVGGSGLRRNGR